MKLEGTHALVTGASSGIGAAISKLLAQRGVRLALSARRAELLETLAERIGAQYGTRPTVLPADLAVEGVAAELATHASSALGSIDILVNAAGAFEAGSATEVDTAARGLFEANYWAAMALVGALSPAMRARGRGAIVNFASLASITPLPRMGSYPASKGALASATEALRTEMAGSGVLVMLAFLGSVDTPMHARASRAYGPVLRWMPLGRAEIAARRIVDGITRGRATVVYPRSVATIRWFPALSARVSGRVILPLLLGRTRCVAAPCRRSC